MKDTKVVAFDLDDVLLDTNSNLDWLYRAFKKTLTNHGIDCSEENLQKLYSKNLHRFDRISEELGIRSDDLWETRNRNYMEEKMKAMKNREIIPFPDIDSLYSLKGTYGLAIISDSPQEIVEFFIKEFDYEDLFECGIGRGSKLEDLQKLKPSPYLLTRIRESIPYGKLIYIGDSEKDRKFAENTGMEFIFLLRREDREFNCLDKIVEYLLT
jgi:phosphoglycolate phosphatase-like HAD superfamily hydrolase